MSNVIQRRVIDLIAIRKTIHLLRQKIDVNVVPCLQAMRISMRLLAPPLEVLPADETRVHVQIRQGDRAEPLEIKIQDLQTTNNQT